MGIHTMGIHNQRYTHHRYTYHRQAEKLKKSRKCHRVRKRQKDDFLTWDAVIFGEILCFESNILQQNWMNVIYVCNEVLKDVDNILEKHNYMYFMS